MAQNNLAARNSIGESFSTYISKDGIKNAIARMLNNPAEVSKFIANTTSVTSINTALQQCDYSTIISSAMVAHSLKLSLSPAIGHCYMVPFEDRKNNRTVATFILGYKGIVQLAVRSNYYKRINVIEIKEGEVVTVDPINEVYVYHIIDDEEVREKTPTVGYYAYFEYIGGFRKEMYWSKKKMERHADKYSKAFNLKTKKDLDEGKIPEKDRWKYSSYWYAEFDEMAKKTMLRQLLGKWGVLSVDMQNAFEKDKESEFTVDDNNNNEGIHPILEDTTKDIAETFFGENE